MEASGGPALETVCRSCGNAHQHRFCPDCGEKRFDPDSLRITHFLEEALEGFFHFDNKFLRSVRFLVTRLGQLSLDRVEGRTVRMVRPFQLFLIVNLIVFVLPFVNPFSLPLYNYLHFRPFTSYGTVEAVNAHMAAHRLALPAFTREFDHAMHGLSKSLLSLFIPAQALLFGLLLVNCRRRVIEHLVFATHYLTLLLLAFLAVIGLLMAMELVHALLGSAIAVPWSDELYTLLITAVLITWLFLAVRRFYGTRAWQAATVAVLVGGSFFFQLQVYRMLLFHVVVHSGH
jgi:hypothetical protein